MYLTSRVCAHISNRYHPTIFALQVGTPVFCIIHQFKAQGMLDLFEYPLAMPHTSSDGAAWIAAFDRFWRERDPLRAHVAERLPKVRDAAGQTIARVNATIDRLRLQ
jgi:polysaccharide pyruvyl transferase WcaK-like protein